MQIRDIQPCSVHVNHRGDWVFVLVHTDAGLTGLGEASHSGNDTLLRTALEHLKTQLIGQNPLHIQAIWHRFSRQDGGRVYQTALSGIEQALWDIMGQALNVPIHLLFGGKMRDRLRLYANINRHITDRSPAGFARAARQAVEDGFTAIKIAPFDELRAPDHVRTGPAATWRPGVERVRAVRAAIGDEVELAIDCHRRMEFSEARRVVEELAECRLFWLEEPVRPSATAELTQLTAHSPMPIASGENLYAIEGFTPFLNHRVVDVIMPDVKHAGGLSETWQIAGAARMHQMLVAPHNPAGPVSTAATAQIISTIPNFLILEYAWGEVDWRPQLLAPPERIEGGYLILPDGPGLGHRLNDSVVTHHLIQP